MGKYKVRILVCGHKPGKWPNDRWMNNDAYMPIQGGKAISDMDLGIQGDDTGDNISEKNRRYCETTVLYWAWKNLKNVEYIGLEHYRRKFKTEITADNIGSLMKGKDFALVRTGAVSNPVAKRLQELICKEDFAIMLDSILELYPDYRGTVVRYFYNNTKFPPFQMFITRREEYDKYCEFLFSILFKAEQRIRPANYTRLNRSLGYMGEYLLGLYCMHNKMKVKYLEHEGENRDTRAPVVRALSALKNSFVFKLRCPVRDIQQINKDVILWLKQDGICLRNI